MVVPLVTVPERVWARAEAKVSARMHRARIGASKAGFASLVKKLLAVADLFLETAALGNQRFIGLVIADPEPQKSIRPFDRQRAVVQRDPGRPYFQAMALSHFLEL